MTVRSFAAHAVFWITVFLGLFSGSLILLFESGALTPYVVELVDGRLAPAGLSFRAGSIHWRPWSGLALAEVVLESRAAPDPAAGAAPRHLASFQRLEVGYRVTDFLRSDPRLTRVRLVRPDIDLDALAAWSRTAPRGAAPDSAAGAGAPPRFAVEHIRLVGGRLRSRSEDLLRDLAVRGRLEASPAGWRLELAESRGRLRIGKFDEEVSLHGTVTLEDGWIGVEALDVSAAGGRLALEGSVDPGGRRDGRLVVRGEDVPLERIGEWAGIQHPLLLANLACDLVATGRPDSVHVAGTLSGRRADEVEREVTFTATRQGSRLAIESFRFRAGGSRVDLTGDLDLDRGPAVTGVATFRDLDPAVALAEPDLSVLDDLDGTLRFQGAGLTRRSFRGSAEVDLQGATAFGLRFEAGRVQLAADRGALTLETARLRIRGSELVGTGTIDRDNVIEARFEGELGDLGVLAHIGGVVEAAAPEGSGAAEVRVAGPLTSPELDATLRLSDAAVWGVDVARLELAAEALRLGATRIEFRASGTGIGREGRRFESVEATGWVDGRKLGLASLALEGETVSLRTAGELEFGAAGRLDARVDRLSLQPRGSDVVWENAGPVRVTRADGSVSVAGLDLRGDGGAVTGEVVVRPGGAASLRAVGRDVDLALLAPFVGHPMSGVLSFDGEGVAGADTAAADVAFDVRDAAFGSRTCESLRGRLVLLGDRIALHDVRMDAPIGRVEVAGALQLPAGTRLPALRDRDARAAALERSVLEDVRVRLDSADLTWLWTRIPRSPVASGAGRVELRLEGPFLGPTADGSVALQGGRVGEEPLDSFVVDVAFDGEALVLRDGRLETGGHHLTAQGVVPLAWTAADPVPRLREGREVDLSLAAQGLPLEALSRLVSLFTILEGTADARVSLAGPPGALRLGGEFTVTNGRLAIPTFDEPLVDGTARGTFDARGVEIAQARFADGRGGVVEGKGRVTLENLRATDFAIDVTAREYHYRSQLTDIRGVGGGSMRILARAATDGRILPFFEGRFRVTRADIGPKALTPPGTERSAADLPAGVVAPPEPPAADQEPLLGPLPPPEPAAAPAALLAEIALRGDRNLWLETPEMRLELAADVVFHATEDYVGLTGDVRTLRGSYSVLNSRFEVQRAEVEFTDASDPGSSYIDAEATTNVLDETVTAYVSGTVAAPDIRLETESGMSEAEIYELLALRIKRGDDGSAPQEGVIGDAFRRSYVAAFTNRFGGELGREIGLDTFAYEEGEVGSRSSVTVGKNVGRDFFFKYRQSVGGASDQGLDPSATREQLESPERALTIEYRLNRILMLQGETGTLPPGDDYLNVDLRAEWGY